jgi:hypothetical protein
MVKSKAHGLEDRQGLSGRDSGNSSGSMKQVEPGDGGRWLEIEQGEGPLTLSRDLPLMKQDGVHPLLEGAKSRSAGSQSIHSS